MCHVLIIEDDWLIADHIAQLVGTAGATSVVTVDNEEDALTQALANPPQVIISDVSLGRGGNGPSAVRRIICSVGERPVLFITGEPRSFQPPSPAMQVLHKPVEDHILVATFQAIAPRR